MVEFLSVPLVGSILGIAGIVVGSLLSVIFYYKSKFVAKPQYAIFNDELINLDRGLLPSEVQITYGDKRLTKLNRTQVSFWNAGKKTIDKTDLSPSFLYMDFGKDKDTCIDILSVEITNQSRECINVDFSVSDNSVLCFNFDYLDYHDRFTISIIHTGTLIPSVIYGNVKGVPKGLTKISSLTKVSLRDILEIIGSSMLPVFPFTINSIHRE